MHTSLTSLIVPDKYPIRIDFLRGLVPYVFTGFLKGTLKPTNQQQGGALAVMSAPIAGASTAEGILNLSTLAMQKFVKDFGERPASLEIVAFDSAGLEIASWTVGCDISRRYTDTGDVAVDIPSLKATKVEAEAGANNEKWMTPLRVRQALAAAGLEII